MVWDISLVLQVTPVFELFISWYSPPRFPRNGDEQIERNPIPGFPGAVALGNLLYHPLKVMPSPHLFSLDP